jgi:hypothetical protein
MRDVQELGLQPDGSRTPPPTGEQIALVERLVGRSLPADYLALLRSCNGCQPTLDYFTVETAWGLQDYQVGAFYALSAATADTDDSGEVVWRYLNGDPDVPPGVLPIGLTPLGDEIYLDLTERGAGRVVLVQHELPAWASGDLPANTELLFEVAPSFAAFLDMLTVTPEEE